MSKTTRPRLFYLDFVRAFALCCILVIHFNASVTGYFSYPSRLFPSILPLGIYLGDFGSSLFFIVSGAALGYTTKPGTAPLTFYRKRAKAVYPMFWLAWFGCFSIRMATRPWMFGGAKLATLVLTVLGLDNFAVASGWVAQDFACVGEWFLGSILFLYLLFPLVQRLLQRSAAVCWLVVCIAALAVHLSGWDAGLVAVHLPEFLFGMAFVEWKNRGKEIGFAACAILLLPAVWLGNSKIVCALFSMAFFVLLAVVGQKLECAPLRGLCGAMGKYSYAAFLVHHVLILRMVEAYDLSTITRRDTALLFGAYLFLTALASILLYRADRWVRGGVWQRLQS